MRVCRNHPPDPAPWEQTSYRCGRHTDEEPLFDSPGHVVRDESRTPPGSPRVEEASLLVLALVSSRFTRGRV